MQRAVSRVLVSSAIVLTGVVAVATIPATAASPSVTIKPNTNLVNNQQVLVSGTGLTGDNGDALIECLTTATDTSGCDVSTEVAISVDSDGVMSPVGFTVATGTIGTGTCGTGSADASSCDLALATGSTGPVAFLGTLTFVVLGDVAGTYSCSKVKGVLTFSPPLSSTEDVGNPDGVATLEEFKFTGSHCTATPAGSRRDNC